MKKYEVGYALKIDGRKIVRTAFVTARSTFDAKIQANIHMGVVIARKATFEFVQEIKI